MSSRLEQLNTLKSYYIPTRVYSVEKEFIEFEEQMISDKDLKTIIELLANNIHSDNIHNSCLLYITGISDTYDPNRNVDTVGGSPPDIDTDFDTIDFQKIIDWMIEHWGRENIANIMALGRFKPRSTVNKYFMVTEPRKQENETPEDHKKKIVAHYKIRNEILEKIPDAIFGKEPTLDEVINGNSEKRNYLPHPELATDPKYKPWYKVACKLENMVSQFGIHAAGIVVSNEPISNHIPVWYRNKKEENGPAVGKWVTQFTMEEVEKIGIIKFDFLRIDNLSIIKETARLIQSRQNIVLDLDNIDVTDTKPYKLLSGGVLTGIFQFETSNSARTLAARIKPTSLEELSDLSSLNRPGPLTSGLAEEYIINKENGYPSGHYPKIISDLLKGTQWILVYQEQIMEILSKVAGFSLKEADDVRRALGKKKKEVLKPYFETFLKGCENSNIDTAWATDFWENTLIKFSDYSFNKSHAFAYSYLTYLCLYLKYYYPTEFYTALMSVRSQTLMPKDWNTKAPSYIEEAKFFGINIKGPHINKSNIEFTIINKDIYFGFSAIKGIGASAAASILNYRVEPFASVQDFLTKVNRTKLNTSNFTNLVNSGAFDFLGYSRQDLLDKKEEMYEYFKIKKERNDRIVENLAREQENIEIAKKIEYRDQLRKKSKKDTLTDDEYAWLENNTRIALLRELAVPEEPVFPVFTRYKNLSITVPQLMEQGKTIGCYLINPAPIVYPDTTRIKDIDIVRTYTVAGIVQEVKTYKGKNTKHIIDISDGTDSLQFSIYEAKAIPKDSLIKITFKGGYLSGDIAQENIKIYKVYSINIYGE